MFNIYENSEPIKIQLVYLRSMAYAACKRELEIFCRYIFDEVFDDMNTQSESILKFDLERSPFKLLPCLLTGN